MLLLPIKVEVIPDGVVLAAVVVAVVVVGVALVVVVVVGVVLVVVRWRMVTSVTIPGGVVLITAGVVVVEC